MLGVTSGTKPYRTQCLEPETLSRYHPVINWNTASPWHYDVSNMSFSSFGHWPADLPADRRLYFGSWSFDSRSVHRISIELFSISLENILVFSLASSQSRCSIFWRKYLIDIVFNHCIYSSFLSARSHTGRIFRFFSRRVAVRSWNFFLGVSICPFYLRNKFTFTNTYGLWILIKYKNFRKKGQYLRTICNVRTLHASPLFIDATFIVLGTFSIDLFQFSSGISSQHCYKIFVKMFLWSLSLSVLPTSQVSYGEAIHVY